jgi:HlyD family secretion protein
VVAAVAVAGWLYFSSGDEPSASSFDLTRYGMATRGDLTVSISAVGAVEPIHAIEIKSKASGEIIELAFEEGDFVSEGELLVRLDPTTVRNEYDQAKADFEVAQVTLEQRGKDLKRQKDLYDRGLISETDYDAARLSYEEANSQHVRARAALSTNTERLEDTEIRSPISGLVLSRQVEEGQIISSGTSSVTGGTL